jgi:hypothetical protein
MGYRDDLDDFAQTCGREQEEALLHEEFRRSERLRRTRGLVAPLTCLAAALCVTFVSLRSAEQPTTAAKADVGAVAPTDYHFLIDCFERSDCELRWLSAPISSRSAPAAPASTATTMHL